jgi:tetratricopeptide (TPR) repeat protein
VTLAEEALQISQSIENLWGLAHSRWLLGHVYFEYGEPDRAIGALEETIRLGVEGSFVPMTTRSDLGWIYGDLGAIERGLEQIQLSLAQVEEMLPEWQSYPLVMRARVHLAGGDLAAAEDALRDSSANLNLENPTNFTALWWILAKSELLLAKQDYQQAVTLTEESVDQLRRFGIRAFIPDGLCIKGEALLALGHLDAAHQVLTEARAEAEALGSRRNLWPILFALSQVETRRGNISEAQQLDQEVRDIIEYIADHAGSPDLRTSFLALPRVRQLFEDTLNA